MARKKVRARYQKPATTSQSTTLPANQRGRPKGTGGKAEELSLEEIRRIDRLLKDKRFEKRNRALFFLGLGTGMRISEMIQLDVTDIAPRRKVLSRIVLEKHSTKSKKSRTIAVSKQAIQHLQAYIDKRFPPPSKPKGPLFPSQKNPNRPMSSTNAILTLEKMFREAGVENASTHSLRRTHANTLRRCGVDLKIIQEQLGHSSLAITERYFEVDPIEHQKAIELLKF